MTLKTSFKSLLCRSVVLVATFMVAPMTLASELPPENQNQSEFSAEQLAQVSSVSQLADVQPSDWAFGALQSLVERYACIAGFPDSTYRGHRVITRYEFAAGLNACLDRLNELIATSTTSLVTQEDLASLEKLQAEFATELATLRTRVDTLEAQIAQLQANQFSTTTKLNGEVIFAVAGVLGDKAADQDDNPDNNPNLEDNFILSDRVRLSFDTSFTGKDLLRTRLQARNIPEFQGRVTGTRMTRLSFAGDEDNQARVDELYYYFPVSDRLAVTVAPIKIELDKIVKTQSPFKSTGTGSISLFGRHNPIYRVLGGAAFGLNYDLNKQISLNLGYTAADAQNPEQNNGLFGGNYNAFAQLFFKPIENLDIGLTYVHSYYAGGGNTGVNITGGTGSENARRPFGNVATSANSFGLETSWRISPKFILSGWAGYSIAESKIGDDEADILNYAITLAFPDLGGKGNLTGFVFGMPPKVIQSSQTEDENTSFHIEGFHRLRITDNISVTPGLFVIINPEHNDNNDNIYVGAIRTTFTF